MTLVLLEQHAAANSPTLDFTAFISGTYDEYMFEIIGLVPVTNAALPLIRMGTGGGPTWDVGANYNWAHKRFLWNGEGVTGNVADTSIALALGLGTAGGLWSFNGSFRLFDPASAIYKQISGKFSDLDTGSTLYTGTECIGAYLSATAVTGIRFLMSAGNISSGTIRAYGISKT